MRAKATADRADSYSAREEAPLTAGLRSIVPHGPVRPYDYEVTGYRDRSGPGLHLKVTSRRALDALNRIGCSATVLY